jgi:hypothetical protein
MIRIIIDFRAMFGKIYCFFTGKKYCKYCKGVCNNLMPWEEEEQETAPVKYKWPESLLSKLSKEKNPF